MSVGAGLGERSLDLAGTAGRETKAPLPALTPPLSHHVFNLCTSPSPSSAFSSVGQTGDSESLNLLVPRPPSWSHPPASTPAREAETHANCSDEATQKNQTSVFNTDDRLACGEFSHPPKQASFCSKQLEQEATYAWISQQSPRTNGAMASLEETKRVPKQGAGGRGGIPGESRHFHS